VTNNCLIKRRKRKIDQELISLDELPGTDEEDVHREPAAWDEIPVEKVMTSELREKLDEAIGKLPVDYRIVFVLRDIENQTAEETARILKLSVPAVKSRLRRARIFLREQLEEYMTA
jgi:RNA polymerase sigma-70 factor (ECF subfamily)